MASLALRSTTDGRRRYPSAQGERLGDWELVSRLAEGRVAEVFAARPWGSQDPPRYALKRLRRVWDDVPEAIASLICEAQAAQDVSHPHVVPVLAAELHQGLRYLVFPLLEGEALALEAGAPHRGLPEILWIARQAAEGLSALHTAGWLHGDIKPQHVIVSPEGHATLIDLGFATPIGTLSMRSAVRGTPRYLAPECLVSTLRVDHRSDLYSLGATLYEWIAGRPPFVGDTMAELARQHRQDRPTDLRALAPGLPLGVVELVRDLLSKSPERRPLSAAEVVERLWPLEIAAFADWEGALDSAGAFSDR